MPGKSAASIGDEMYEWACDLYPIHRSLTGSGVRRTLEYIGGRVPGLTVLEAPSGTPAFDWIVPNEWTIRDAYIADESGARVVDYRRNNLHVVGYSIPVDAWLSREELEPHLHSLPSQPAAIPYVTSYYAPYWGFCLSDAQRVALPDGRYHVVVDSDLSPGVMNVGEVIIPGDTDREILLSANICHPSLANNEVSGPVVLTALARWIAALPTRRYTYRLVFLPETIGSIWYLSRNAAHMKTVTEAGFVLTCVGDDRAYSYVPSRAGGTPADRAALNVLRHRAPDFVRYTFLDRASDERQYCSPGIDLPVCSVLRTLYGKFPEYHTSFDDLSVISPAGLQGAFEVLRECLEVLEANDTYVTSTPCEPQLGRRGLYPTTSDLNSYPGSQYLLDVLAYADGTRDLIALADAVGISALRCRDVVRILRDAGLMAPVVAEIRAT